MGCALNVIFLADPPDGQTRQRVLSLKSATDEFRVRGREIYWLRRKKPGQSTYATVPLERALRQPFTIRGAATLKKLVAKIGGRAG
jgi:uncharacterized protein (DUF1697 family)